MTFCGAIGFTAGIIVTEMRRLLMVPFLLFCLGTLRAQKPVPILFDTDIGDDIDDALALGLALQSPELDVRGVTTVSDDVQS
ncbi:MAG: hypothetical protein ACREMY_14775, partial [bacterium]